MKSIIPAVAIAIVATFPGGGKPESGGYVVLPNAKLIGCRSPNCSQLWQEQPSEKNSIFPMQMSIDMEKGCPIGVVARYDKTVTLLDIKAAIDQRYGKWAVPDNGDPTVPVKLWRVTPEKFAIQLATVDEEMEKMTLGQSLAQPIGQLTRKGPTVAEQVIYLAFPGTTCGDRSK
jgi:hypothetical protein